MKKLIINIFLTIFLLLPVNVFAEGDISVSPSSLTIEVGSSKTFTINAYNTIGDISISPSNSKVASVSTSEWGTGMVDEGITKTTTITVKGVSVGTSTITLTIDAATYDSEDLTGQKRTITVNVVAKAENSNTTTTESKNTNLKKISVDNYELVKVNDNNYTLSVSYSTTSINITATAEDSKATITGTGKHELNIGENNIELIVTSSSGLKNKITVKVTRKSGYYLEDLEDILNDSTQNDIDIKIDKDSKLSSQNLTKIKNSRKIVNLNYYDESNTIIYSWILDGSKITDFDELATNISFESIYSKEISKLSNYAEGIYLNINNNDNIPSGTKIKTYVASKYSDEDIVNIYYYNKDTNQLEIIKDNLSIKDGYIEFDINKGTDYFITMSTINNIDNIPISFSNETSKIVPILILIIIILTITLILVCISKKKKPTKKITQNNEEMFNNQINNLDMNNLSNNQSNIYNNINK